MSEGFAELEAERIWSEYLSAATEGVPEDELHVLLRQTDLMACARVIRAIECVSGKAERRSERWTPALVAELKTPITGCQSLWSSAVREEDCGEV